MVFTPEELNAARQCLLDGVIDYFLAKEGIEALYIQGSVAAGSTDEFSDIDFRVVIQPSAYEQYISERFSAPKYWGEWLYNEWADRFWVCVSHWTVGSFCRSLKRLPRETNIPIPKGQGMFETG